MNEQREVAFPLWFHVRETNGREILLKFYWGRRHRKQLLECFGSRPFREAYAVVTAGGQRWFCREFINEPDCIGQRFRMATQ
jgi:hypothetical protein